MHRGVKCTDGFLWETVCVLSPISLEKTIFCRRTMKISAWFIRVTSTLVEIGQQRTCTCIFTVSIPHSHMRVKTILAWSAKIVHKSQRPMRVHGEWQAVRILAMIWYAIRRTSGLQLYTHKYLNYANYSMATSWPDGMQAIRRRLRRILLDWGQNRKELRALCVTATPVITARCRLT